MEPDIGVVLIVLFIAFAIVGSMYVKHKFGASKEELGQIHAELKELKESVAKIQEYIADIYIQVSEHQGETRKEVR